MLSKSLFHRQFFCLYFFSWIVRIKDNRRILDNATRKRRQQRQLDALEKDNTHEDPHGHINVLQAKGRIPAFNDTMEGINEQCCNLLLPMYEAWI